MTGSVTVRPRRPSPPPPPPPIAPPPPVAPPPVVAPPSAASAGRRRACRVEAHGRVPADRRRGSRLGAGAPRRLAPARPGVRPAQGVVGRREHRGGRGRTRDARVGRPGNRRVQRHARLEGARRAAQPRAAADQAADDDRPGSGPDVHRIATPSSCAPRRWGLASGRRDGEDRRVQPQMRMLKLATPLIVLAVIGVLRLAGRRGARRRRASWRRTSSFVPSRTPSPT